MPDATFWVLLAQAIIQGLGLVVGSVWYFGTQRQNQQQDQQQEQQQAQNQHVHVHMNDVIERLEPHDVQEEPEG